MVQETTPDAALNASSNQLVVIGQLRRELADVMRIQDYEVLRPPDEVIAFRGYVEGDTDAAFDKISQRFASHDYTAWLRDRPGGSGHEIVATRGVSKAKSPRVWPNVLLLVATIFTVLYIGAGYALADAGIAQDLPPGELLLQPLIHITLGIPFAATLMGILLAHELSHYFVSRRYGAPVSLPYFIPMPNILGTMGAVIVQREPMRSRKAVFDIGVAGPIGGLIVAIPLLILGLSLSEVGSIPPGVDVVTQEGNSLLYLGLKYLVFGQVLPRGDIDVWLHPVAFAAWAGLLVTMINLIPVGQLDGGHISYALLGRWSWRTGDVATVAMIAWGGWLVLNGNEAGGFWLVWGFINLILNRRHPPPLNDVSRVGGKRIALGVLMMVLFILLFMPSPLREIRVPPGPSGVAVWLSTLTEVLR
jgi:membrane-associated protease RseP (regulator of RpoE activity)